MGVAASMRADGIRLLEREQGPQDRLVWSGRPRADLVRRPVDAGTIPFSPLWGGFAIFGRSSAGRRLDSAVRRAALRAL